MKTRTQRRNAEEAHYIRVLEVDGLGPLFLVRVTNTEVAFVGEHSGQVIVDVHSALDALESSRRLMTSLRGYTRTGGRGLTEIRLSPGPVPTLVHVERADLPLDLAADLSRAKLRNALEAVGDIPTFPKRGVPQFDWT